MREPEIPALLLLNGTPLDPACDLPIGPLLRRLRSSYRTSLPAVIAVNAVWISLKCPLSNGYSGSLGICSVKEVKPR
jgi:hypothetical protein